MNLKERCFGKTHPTKSDLVKLKELSNEDGGFRITPLFFEVRK
jgi:hypothetical protein